MARVSEYEGGDRVNFTMVEDDQLTAPLVEIQRNWIECMTKVNGEFLNFLNRRVKQDLEAASQFAACKNPADFFQTQMQFVQKMAADYTEEAQKMTEIMSEIANNDQTNGAGTPH